MSTRKSILDEAESLINGDRNANYGPPTQDFARTAALWTVYLAGRTDIAAHDVAAMMALLKISRIVWSPENRDHWVDLAGYAACGFECTLDDIPWLDWQPKVDTPPTNQNEHINND